MATTSTDPRVIDGILYNESDADIPSSMRTRWTRMVFFFLCLGVAIVLPALVVGIVLSLIPWTGTFWLGAIIGGMVGLSAFGSFVDRFFVTVEQATCFVTMNPALGLFRRRGSPNVIYGPGFSFAFPWERRSSRSNLSLQIITIPWRESVPGAGAQLIVTGAYQFKVNLLQADKFVEINDQTITGGVIQMIQQQVSQSLASLDVNTAKSQINMLSQTLGAHFGVGGGNPSQEVETFHGQYGVRSVRLTVSGIDLPPDVQRARDAVDEAGQAVRSVAAMSGIDENVLKAQLTRLAQDQHMTFAQYIDMLHLTMVQGKAATMNLQAFKFGERLETAIGEVLARLMSGGQGQPITSGTSPSQVPRQIQESAEPPLC